MFISNINEKFNNYDNKILNIDENFKNINNNLNYLKNIGSNIINFLLFNGQVNQNYNAFDNESICRNYSSNNNTVNSKFITSTNEGKQTTYF